MRGFLDLLTILFIGRFRHRPMHLFGGLGLVVTAIGVVISAYMAVLRFTGHGIGNRPLLLLGVLAIVVGIQLFTIGLVSEMIQFNRQRSEGDELGAAGGAGHPLRALSLRLLWLGTYERDYPRNRVLVAGLRELGAEVVECHRPVWERTRHKAGGFLRPLPLLAAGGRYAAAWAGAGGRRAPGGPGRRRGGRVPGPAGRPAGPPRRPPPGGAPGGRHDGLPGRHPGR